MAAEGKPGLELAAQRRAPRVRLSDPETARRVRAAVEGARRKLSRDECRKLLWDFHDADSRTLAANLEAQGKEAEEYLQELYFYDGAAQGPCYKSGLVARTTPGSRVILICRGFARAARKGHGFVENIVIHEMLHTLGLGENPPASTEINAAVARRCGP